jgi:hypothetical protein
MIWAAVACTLLSTIRCSPARAPEAAVAMIRKSHPERGSIRWDLGSEAAAVVGIPEVLEWVAGRLIRSEGLETETSFEKKMDRFIGLAFLCVLFTFSLEEFEQILHDRP